MECNGEALRRTGRLTGSSRFRSALRAALLATPALWKAESVPGIGGIDLPGMREAVSKHIGFWDLLIYL